MKVVVVIAVAAMGLAGCGPGKGPAAQDIEAKGDADVPSPAPRSVAEPAANAAAAATSARIPAAFQGAWRAAGGTCAEGSELRIAVGPDGILFHESYAGVSSARSEGDGRLTMSMVVSGEGEVWTEQATLTLSDEGRTLTRTLADGRTLGYTRCS